MTKIVFENKVDTDVEVPTDLPPIARATTPVADVKFPSLSPEDQVRLRAAHSEIESFLQARIAQMLRTSTVTESAVVAAAQAEPEQPEDTATCRLSCAIL